MFLDPILLQYEEDLDLSRFIIATYACSVRASASILKYAAALAVEQTTGTWLPVPGETQEVRDRCIGRVVGVYEMPAYQIGLPEDLRERQVLLRIAYPWANFGPQFAMMLSTVIGNISSSGKLKLLDLSFPKAFLSQFQGPKFGIPGIRDLLGVYDRPLLNNMIKPCTGLTPKETAALAYEVALGGVDIIKDDELVANAPHCPLTERVRAVMDAVREADLRKKEKTLYAFNITDRTEKLKENAYKAIESGANCLMVNYNTTGLDAARMLSDDPAINVPLLAHPDYTGAVYASPAYGMSAGLIGAKLPRLAGMDMIITLTPYGKFPMLMDTFISSGYMMQMPLGNIRPVFAMPGGGTTPGHVEDIILTPRFTVTIVICVMGGGGRR